MTICTITNAHTGIGFTKNFENIRVHSYKETDIEDFRKAFIIGELASKLAKAYNYTDQIYLDCWLSITSPEDTKSDYQISTQVFNYSDEDGGEKEKLIIRQQAQQYDVIQTLKLIEYSIKNKAKIKRGQELIQSTFFYDRGEKKYSISANLIQKILQEPTSKIIEQILKSRIERPLLTDERPSEITYYWSNNLYHIYRHWWGREKKDQQDIVLLTLPSIYQFVNLDLQFLVFNTTSSFYYLNINDYDSNTKLNKVSTRHVIEDIGNKIYNRTFKSISDGDVSIYFTHGPSGWGKKRLLIYYYKPDTLIQNVYSSTGIEPFDLEMTHQRKK